MTDKYPGMSVAQIREAQMVRIAEKAPAIKDTLADGLEGLFDQLRAILGVDLLPPAAVALKNQYGTLLFNLSRDVALGTITTDEARYELQQARNGLVQAIGSIGLDLLGKRRAALQAAGRQTYPRDRRGA